MKRKTYREWSPDQRFLFSPDPRQWLPEGHMAYYVMDVVQALDLSAIEDVVQGKDARGERPYNPRMMVALLLYGYATGVFSSRELSRKTYEDVAFRYLSGGDHPHFTTVADFRKRHLQALSGLFVEVLRLCQQVGLVRLGRIALDGTKIQANASKHKGMSYARIRREHERLREEIEQLLLMAKEADETEDQTYGEGNDPLDLPQALKSREERLRKLAVAKSALELQALCTRIKELERQISLAQRQAKHHQDDVVRRRSATRAKRLLAEKEALEAKTSSNNDKSDGDEAPDDPEPPGDVTQDAPQASPPAADDEDTSNVADAPTAQVDPPDKTKGSKGLSQVPSEHVENPDDLPPESANAELPLHQTPATPKGTPVARAQYNFTDSDSRIMKRDGAYLQGYNCQAAVDAHAQVIVAHGLSNQAADNHYTIPVLQRVKEQLACTPSKLLADAGYWSPAGAAWCEENSITPYISLQREHRGSSDATPRNTPYPDAPRERMRRRLSTPEGKAIYRKRQGIVEPVFGQIKEAMRFRRFSLRGLRQVRLEWALVCTAHNLKKLFAHQRRTCTA